MFAGWFQMPGVTVSVFTRPQSETPPTASALDVTDVYAREFAYVWHTLRRLGVAARDLPDVTHDVFVVVHRKAASFEPDRPVRPWLFGIAYRVARDHLHAAWNRKAAMVESIDDPDPAPGQDQQLASAQAQALVHEALQSLDLDRRAVFILHDIEELSMTEVSSVLEVPAKTLYARLAVARTQFVAAVRRIELRRGGRP
jgi:RNA polymerase sigma-70 factor (ECF subfamily)